MAKDREKPLKWYVSKHRKDTRGANHTTISVWRAMIDIMHECESWRLAMTVQRFAAMFRTNPIDMMLVLQELLELGIADIEYKGERVDPGSSLFAVHDITIDFGAVTVISRRRRKKAKERAGNRERQRRHQAKKKA